MTLGMILRIGSVKVSLHLVGYRKSYAGITENGNVILAREIGIVLVYFSRVEIECECISGTLLNSFRNVFF